MNTTKVTCQFPIVEIFDLSSTDVENPNVNGWEVTRQFDPYDEQIRTQSTLVKNPRLYNVSVWARVGEELTFR